MQVSTAAVRMGLLSSTPRSTVSHNIGLSTNPLGMLMLETSESPAFMFTGSLWMSEGSNQLRTPLS
jgi:hypothetical protein